MFVFGTVAGPSDRLAKILGPSLARFAPDAPLILRREPPSLAVAYNSIIEEALDRFPDLACLVLLHDDVEVQGDLCAALRSAMQPDVGIIGAIGGSTDGFAWWEGRRRGRVEDSEGVHDFGFDPPEVDTVDGLLLALTPIALAALRFDTARFTGFHGYDRDICRQARAAGFRTIVAPLPVRHHSRSPDLLDPEFVRARQVWRWKWSSPRQRAFIVGRGVFIRLRRVLWKV